MVALLLYIVSDGIQSVSKFSVSVQNYFQISLTKTILCVSFKVGSCLQFLICYWKSSFGNKTAQFDTWIAVKQKFQMQASSKLVCVSLMLVRSVNPFQRSHLSLAKKLIYLALYPWKLENTVVEIQSGPCCLQFSKVTYLSFCLWSVLSVHCSEEV